MQTQEDLFKLGPAVFTSRLFVGTGKFSSAEILKQVIEASGTEMVTVSLRRVDFSNNDNTSLLSAVDRSRVTLLPNTSGAANSKEAIRLARLAREAGCGDWVKLELTPEPRYLMPDGVETLEAAKVLVKEGFHVLPYIHADPILAKRLEDIGVAAVMPLGSPIGSNQGLQTRLFLEMIIEQSNVPVIVDAGLGTPSHAAAAMEMGADAVLVNTALAIAGDPVQMAVAFKMGVQAGRMARLCGMGSVANEARASSPLTGFLDAISS
ncbi:MAG: thiazole synthase [SAR324 cluster bacterium]|nr:thiazole synthase [SAR324 cluster bacterium]